MADVQRSETEDVGGSEVGSRATGVGLRPCCREGAERSGSSRRDQRATVPRATATLRTGKSQGDLRRLSSSERHPREQEQRVVLAGGSFENGIVGRTAVEVQGTGAPPPD